MLTTTAERPPDVSGRRRHAVRASVWPTLRLANLHLVVATVALAGIPLLVSVARSSSDAMLPLVLLFLASGAAIGWALDDPAAEVLSAAPIGSPHRLRTRVFAAALLSACGLGVALALVQVSAATLPTHGRMVESIAAASVAAAVGLVAARRGGRAVGQAAVMAGLLCPVVLASFAMRLPALLPSFDAGPTHERWWWVAAVAAVVAARAGRDPAR